MPDRFIAAPVIGALVVIAGSHVVRAQQLDASTADALSAQFTANGYVTTLPAVAPVAGTAPPTYNKKVTLGAFNTILNIADSPVTAAPPALYATLSGIAYHVDGSGLGVDNYGSEGDATVTSGELSLNLNPPPPAGGAVPLAPLSISASAVHATGSYSVVVPQPPRVAGSASFGSLSVSGALVGGETLTYSGTPPANFTLYSSPNITITLNEQLVVSIVLCVPGGTCTPQPAGIAVAAMHVALANANIFGGIISGDIYLAQAHAD